MVVHIFWLCGSFLSAPRLELYVFRVLLGIGSICEITATVETCGYISSCLLYFIPQSCHMVIEAPQIVTGLNTIV